MGKGNTVVPEEKTSLKMCILVPSTVMSSWKHVAAVSFSCLTDAIPQRIIDQARYYRSQVLLDKIINIIVRWLQVVPVCMGTYCSHQRVLGHMELLPASHYMFINGVRAWTYMEQWPSSTTPHRSQKIIGQVHQLLHLMLLLHRCLRSSSPTTTSSTTTTIYIMYNFNIHPSTTTSTTVLL